MIHKIFRLKFALLIILNLLAGASAYAASGDLDPTFDGDGVVFTDNSSADIFRALVVQPDGKVVIAGTTRDSNNRATRIFIRYGLDGSLDGTFGTGGKFLIPTLAAEESPGISSLAIAPDGKIVFVGTQTIFQFDVMTVNFFVGRLNTNGTLDTTFNGTGTGVVDFYGQVDRGYGVVVQPDGKIVFSGTSGGVTPSVYDFAMVRLEQNGSIDSTFNGDGFVITSITSRRDLTDANKIVLQPDGKIVAVGTAGVPGSTVYRTLFTARYNANGTLDTTFDGDGIALTRQSELSSSNGTSVAITPDGKVLAGGGGRPNNGAAPNTIYFVQYNSDGSLDQSFGIGGMLPYSNSFGAAAQIAVQPDGKILAVDSSVVLRLFPNGTIDNTFSGDGYNRIPVPSGNDSGPIAIGLDVARKKVYAGGYSRSPNDSYDFMTARFFSDICERNCTVARNKIADFDGDGKTDLSVFRSGKWYINRSSANNSNDIYGFDNYGSATDKLTPADFDGDRKTDVSYFRDGNWFWFSSSNNTFGSFNFGLAGDIPVPADYTGDGRAELAVYRAGVWHTYNLASNQYVAAQFGLSNDKPVPADFDADGKTDFAVYRGGVWYVQRSTEGFIAVQFGIDTDKPVVGDYDGDYRADYAVYRDGVWYVYGSSNGVFIAQFGVASDVPVPADYDGDGKTDLAIFRNGVWWINRTQSGVGVYQFGVSNDKPLPSAFLP